MIYVRYAMHTLPIKSIHVQKDTELKCHSTHTVRIIRPFYFPSDIVLHVPDTNKADKPRQERKSFLVNT